MEYKFCKHAGFIEDPCYRRNGISPSKGIGTNPTISTLSFLWFVEMGVLRVKKMEDILLTFEWDEEKTKSIKTNMALILKQPC